MMMTAGTRISDGGSTEVTIADGLVYIDLFRNNIHIEQRRYDATDLINMNLDIALMAGASTRRERNRAQRETMVEDRQSR